MDNHTSPKKDIYIKTFPYYKIKLSSGWITLFISLIAIILHVCFNYDKLPKICVCYFKITEEISGYCDKVFILIISLF